MVKLGKDNGFTLIELLAVIVILAIILVVAVPKIMKAIDSSKINAYISNEKLVLKSAELYVSKNIDTLPANIGDTSEILLSSLITDGYIKDIKSPFNKNDSCSGYVLITKTANDLYDYTPHINCIDGAITSSTQDKLLLHYKFDDYSEATVNVSIIDGQGTISPFSGDGGPSLSIVDPIVTYNGRKIVRFRTGSNGNFYINGGSVLSSAKSSINWTFTFYIKRVDGSSITNDIGTYMYLTNNTNVNTTVSPIPVGDGWYKIIRTRENVVLGYPTLVGCYDLGNNIEYYIANWLIEPKSYATPFESSLNNSYVSDYSVNNNDAQLTVDNTPKWIYSAERKSGAYVFDKTKTLINKSNISPAVNNFTLSSWININSHSTDANIGQIIINNYSSSKGWIFSVNGPNSKLQIRNHNGTSTVYNLYNSTGLNLNTWYHVVATDDGTTVRLFVNGIQVASCNSQPAIQYTDMVRIGSFTDTIDIFDGTIDDVRIYSRALSPNEIKILYESTK